MAEWNDPGIELEKKTDELEELKERLILQQTASFTVEYNLKTRKYYKGRLGKGLYQKQGDGEGASQGRVASGS